MIPELSLFITLTFMVLFVTSTILYSTVKLGISPMPSSNKAYRAMMQLADETGTGTIIDMGSGWGNFVIPIAKKYPQRQIVGYELSYLPWLISTLLKKTLGLKNLTLHRQSFYKADFSIASVLVCYLFPEAMDKISKKLRLEQAGVNFVISNNFVLPLWQHSKVIHINDFYKSPIYLYDISNGKHK